MSRTLCRHFPLLLLVPALFSCADAAKHLRAQPALFTGPKETVEVRLTPLDERGAPSALASNEISLASLPAGQGSGSAITAPGGDVIRLMCVRAPRSTDGAPTETASIEQCLYHSIDLQDALKVQVRNKAERNRLVYLLMNVSESNCSTFLMRAFANKAGADATRNTGKDIATAIAAGTARVASGVSSGLGLINLVGGSAIDNFSASYYADKTFGVMAAAIEAERDKARTRITKSAPAEIADYSYYEALLDWRKFDDACSLRRGLESLAKAATDQKKSTEKILDNARDKAIAPAKQTGNIASAEPAGH